MRSRKLSKVKAGDSWLVVRRSGSGKNGQTASFSGFIALYQIRESSDVAKLFEVT